MKKIHFLKQGKLALVSSSLALILAACGGGGSSSDTAPADTTNGDATATNTQTPPPSTITRCSVNRLVLSPASGTISKSQTSLRATIDFEALNLEDIEIAAYIHSADDGDDVILSNTANIKKVDNGRGQALLAFDLKNYQGLHDVADPDHYTKVSISLRHSGGLAGCRLTQDVDYYLIP